MASEDLNSFVTSIATKKPYLTDSVHKSGAGSKSPSDDVKSIAEREIKYGMPPAEEAKILKARRELKQGA